MKINSPYGREHAEFYIRYNKNQDIKRLSVKIIDKDNRLVRELKNKEIDDNSLISGYFHTDDRYKSFKAIHNTYPYFVEVSYLQKFDEYFSFPSWYPQNGKNIAVRNSRYTLKIPAGYSFTYKNYNFDPKETITEAGGDKIYKWEINNLKPINIQEPYNPPLISLYPHGIFTPVDFQFGGISGSLRSWKEFGSWNSALIENLDALPSDEKQKIKELTENCTNDSEKVKVLYNYLQENTRYVGVFVGIGGWKPFSANYVCTNKYGDCKGLVNYLKAMLKVVDIPSYYALIRAGEDEPDIDTTYVRNQFNHVVLYVPLSKDTFWLECTSQRIPFGYWGSFTQGKHALVCNGSESFLRKTPTLSHAENYHFRKITAEVSNDDLNTSVTRKMGGVFGEKTTELIYNKSRQKILEISNNYLPYENFIVNEISYPETDSTGYRIEETANLSISNHIQSFGENLVLKNIISLKELENLSTDTRSNPIYIKYNREYRDTITYRFPEGYAQSFIPEAQDFSNKFGLIEYSVETTEREIHVTSRIVIHKSLNGKQDYSQLTTLINKINQFENLKFLLEK